MYLYTDNGCCNGKIGGTYGKAGRTWKEQFKAVKLDGMHLMMRLHRCLHVTHPRREKLMKDLSKAIYR